jgi:hypothetical protein
MRLAVQRALKLLIGLAIGVLLCEALLWLTPRSLLPHEFRLLDRVYTARGAWQDMMTADPDLGYKLRPDLDILFPSEGRLVPIRTTSLGLGDIGFRDLGTRPPFTVVAVGDSFVLCDDVPVEACWVRQLADATGISMTTLGVNGYSNLAAGRVLAGYGRQLQPRLVLAGVFPNDFKDNVNFEEWTRSGSDNFWVWQGRRRGRGQFGRTLARYSMLFRIFDGATRARGRKIHRYQEGNLDFSFRFDRWWVELTKDAEHHAGFPLMQQALLRMRDDARAVGAELAVILFPTKEQVYWDIARRYAPDDLDVDHPLAVVDEFCRTNGLHCCDLSEDLRAEARRGRQLYLRIRSHWNDEGNAAGARAIKRCLEEKGLLRLAEGAGGESGS